MNVLHVNTTAVRGGAAFVARQLHDELRARGHRSWMAVGRRDLDDPDVLTVPNAAHSGGWGRSVHRLLRGVENRLSRMPGAPQAAGVLRLAHSRQALGDTLRGHEVFDYPGTRAIPHLPPEPPDVLHLHNLHGGYFDLRALPELSAAIPTVVTLHDAWLLSGHCAHSFDCERWRTGCGSCPYLRTYPPLLRDGTAHNWRIKRDLYAASELHVVTPSRWLMEKVTDSIVMEAARSTTVIPNAVDVDQFTPGDAAGERRRLGIHPSAVVALAVGNANRRDPFKGFAVLEAALKLLARRDLPTRLIAVMVGDDAPTRSFGQVELRFVPFEADRRRIAALYRSADLFVHPALAENFPLVTLEAQACGLPVLASGVGGVPEQVIAVEDGAGADTDHDEATGILLPPGDATALARGIERLAADAGLRARLGRNARRHAEARFGVDGHVERYLAVYEQARRSSPRAHRPDAS